MKVIRLSAPDTGRFYPLGSTLVLLSVKTLRRTQGHSANNPIGNQTSDIPACSTVPQLNAPPQLQTL
jgi:hypothetical protein